MATPTSRPQMQFEFKPLPKKQPKLPIFVPITLVTLALVALTVVILTGGDAATGLGRAGWLGLGLGALCLLGFVIALIRKRTVLGFNAIGLIILAVFFAALGVTGVLVETPLHTVQADSYKKDGKYEQAIAEYRKGDPSSLKTSVPESYLLWGDQLVKNQKFDQAIDNYRKVPSPEFSPNKYSDTAKKQIGAAYLAWGLLLERDGEKDADALAKYDEVVKDGNNPDAIDQAKNQARAIIFRVGDSALNGGDFEQAIATYRKAVDLYGAAEADLKPYFSKTYLAWGKKLLAGNDFEGALSKLEPNLKQYGVGPDVNTYNLAIVDAYAGIGKQLLADKKYDDLLNRLGPAFTSYGKFDSKGQLQSILGDSLTGMASGFETSKDYAKAIDTYEKALTYVGNRSDLLTSLKSKLVSLHLAQGEDFINQAQFEKAIASFQRALQRYPNPATNGLLRADTAKAYFGWAQQAEKAGDFQTALNRYRIILRDYGDLVEYTKPASDSQPRLIFAVAQKLANDKDYDGAIQVYQQLIDNFGGTGYAQDARNLLAASQDVTVVILNNNGQPIPNLKVKLDEDWTKNGDVFEPKGRSMDFTTNASGAFTVKLVPNKTWLLSYFKNGSYTSSFRASDGQPVNFARSAPLRTTTLNQTVNLP